MRSTAIAIGGKYWAVPSLHATLQFTDGAPVLGQVRESSKATTIQQEQGQRHRAGGRGGPCLCIFSIRGWQAQARKEVDHFGPAKNKHQN